MNSKKILFVILLTAFLTRIAGVTYGLPLRLVGDESPYVVAALKMIEMKTLWPRAHYEEFQKILYFPPFIAYIYVAPFLAVLAAKFIFFKDGLDNFIRLIIYDPSSLFITARIINVFFGVLTVWLIYKTAKNIFQKEAIALLSSAFLALSLLHIDLSFLGRDWVINVFMFSLVFYLLSRPRVNRTKRYFQASVIAGLGFGMHLLAAFAALFIGIWYFFDPETSRKNFFKNKIPYLSAGIFGLFALADYLIYPFGYLLGNSTSNQTKTIVGALKMQGALWSSLAHSEPVLFIFVVIGAGFLFLNLKKYFWMWLIFIAAYISVFYFIFYYQNRFTLYLYPLFAIIAGYGLYNLWLKMKNKNRRLIMVLSGAGFALMLFSAIKLDFLVLKNDTRLQARRWIEANLPSQTKIIVASPLARLASTPDTIKEQEKIQASSLRQVDLVERDFATRYTFHALNLYTITEQESSSFYENIEEYLKNNQYQYIFLSQAHFSSNSKKEKAWQTLEHMGTVLAIFKGSENYGFDFTSGALGDISDFFKLENPGPDTFIISLEKIGALN